MIFFCYFFSYNECLKRFRESRSNSTLLIPTRAEGQFIISASQRFTCSKDVDPLQAPRLKQGSQPCEKFTPDNIFAQVTLLLISAYESHLSWFKLYLYRTQLGNIWIRVEALLVACASFSYIVYSLYWKSKYMRSHITYAKKKRAKPKNWWLFWKEKGHFKPRYCSKFDPTVTVSTQRSLRCEHVFYHQEQPLSSSHLSLDLHFPTSVH